MKNPPHLHCRTSSTSRAHAAETVPVASTTSACDKPQGPEGHQAKNEKTRQGSPKLRARFYMTLPIIALSAAKKENKKHNKHARSSSGAPSAASCSGGPPIRRTQSFPRRPDKGTSSAPSSLGGISEVLEGAGGKVQTSGPTPSSAENQGGSRHGDQMNLRIQSHWCLGLRYTHNMIECHMSKTFY